MNKNKMLKITNPIIGLLVINQIITGMIGFKMPHELFEIIHEGSGFLLAIGVLLHIILNWNWIKSNYLKRSK